MANKVPVKAIYTGSDVTSLGEYSATDTIAKTYLDTDLADLTADQSWTGSQRGTTVVDNDGSFDMNGGNNFKCTPTGAITLTFTNITNGQSGFILLVNSGQTVSAHANTKVDANLLATVTAAGTYLVSYFSDGTNVYLTNSAVYA
jgi:oxalate decarboxylase/phosphoglucose isomerase-like protein (cupin superfamily)